MAFLGLGSNLGDRLANLQAAVDALQGEPGLRVTGVQPCVGDGAGGRAAAARLPERRGPGRRPTCRHEISSRSPAASSRAWVASAKERWGARTIDVDILLFDDETIDEPDLVVPHPRMTQRAFVLLPLLELEPDPMLPDGTRLKDVRVDTDGVTPSAPPLAVRR